MHLVRLLTILLAALAISPASAGPAEALRIQKTYQLALEKWTLEMRSATTPAEQQKIALTHPDPVATARKIWENISTSLGQEAALEPAAWLLNNTPELTPANTGTGPDNTSIFTAENEAIRTAIEAHHLASPKLIPVCAALAAYQNSHSLAILEKIQATHPDPKIQGTAAFAAAIQLKPLGDEGEIIKKRLNYLRKAIINSSDVELDGSTIAKLAEDELYIIRFLTKGRIAPDLVGVDSASRPLSLESFKGKIIILLFWNSELPDSKRIVEITTAMETKFKGRPLAVIGVNNDTEAKLRTLQADNTVPWQNFSDPDGKLAQQYRVNRWPLMVVLDGERKIHYVGTPGSFAELTADALLSEVK